MGKNEFEDLITAAAAKEIERVLAIAFHECGDDAARFIFELLTDFTANVVDNCNAILNKKLKEES